MNGDDGDDVLSAIAGSQDLGASMSDIKVEVVGPAIHQQRNGIEIAHDLGGAGKRHGWHDNRLTSFEADRFEGEMEGSGAGVYRDGVAMAEITGKLSFELLHLWSGGEPAFAQS